VRHVIGRCVVLTYPQLRANNNEDTFAPAKGVLAPTPQHVVAVGWTSPVSATVTIAGDIVSEETKSPETSACSAAGLDSWVLEVNGSPVDGQGGPVPSSAKGPQSISATVAVSTGDTIDLVVTAGDSAIADPACAASGVALQIQAPAAVPAVTLDQPGAGTIVNNGEPTFSGSAANAFGDSATVTVRIYSGASIGPAALVQTLTTSRSGGAYSVAPSPFLYDDTYTVQAEQDDLVGDAGLSSKVTFKLADFLPPITLGSLGSKPLLMHGHADAHRGRRDRSGRQLDDRRLRVVRHSGEGIPGTPRGRDACGGWPLHDPGQPRAQGRSIHRDRVAGQRGWSRR